MQQIHFVTRMIEKLARLKLWLIVNAFNCNVVDDRRSTKWYDTSISASTYSNEYWRSFICQRRYERSESGLHPNTEDHVCKEGTNVIFSVRHQHIIAENVFDRVRRNYQQMFLALRDDIVVTFASETMKDRQWVFSRTSYSLLRDLVIFCENLWLLAHPTRWSSSWWRWAGITSGIKNRV